MKKLFIVSIAFSWVFLLQSLCSLAQPKVFQLGPVLHTTYTVWQFGSMINTQIPTGNFEAEASTTVLLPPPPNSTNEYASFIIDIGENNGNLVSIHTPKIIVFDFSTDPSTQEYNSIEIKAPRGVPPLNGASLGRCDGSAVFGPHGKIYILTYEPGYLIEFNYLERTAFAYKFPDGLTPFSICSGPEDNALIYGGTFYGSRVWWFDPVTKEFSHFAVQSGLDPEIDPQQTYVNSVVGKGDWLYATLNENGYPEAYNSVYAINIRTHKKYLLFHSTGSGWSMGGVYEPTGGHAGENNPFLILENGKKAGTIYSDPLGIDMFAPLPHNVLSNCPCYNIDPTRSSFPFTGLLTYPDPFNVSDLPSNLPYSIYRYNENYAWDAPPYYDVPTIPLNPPPYTTGKKICNENLINYSLAPTNPSVNHEHFLNVPWGLFNYSNFPGIKIPSNFAFRLNGQLFDMLEPVAGGHAQLWSQDPILSMIPIRDDRPRTIWDPIHHVFSYQFKDPHSGLWGNVNPIPVGLKSDIPLLDKNLDDYDAVLSGLAMTTSSGAGYPDGATTLVKGEKHGGIALLDPCHNQYDRYCMNPAKLRNGYKVTYIESVTNEQNDILPLGESYNGSDFATHMIAGYPGGVDMYNLKQGLFYGSLCSQTQPSSPCNPRRVSELGAIISTAPGGEPQYGPHTSIGARLYETPNISPNPNPNHTHYKIISMGEPNRKRDDHDVTVGIHEFDFDVNGQQRTITTPTGGLRVVDLYTRNPDQSYLQYYKDWCLTNEATSLNCMFQTGNLRNINSPYNEGIGGYFLDQTAIPNVGCQQPPNGFLKMVVSVRPKDSHNTQNELWIFDPVNEIFENNNRIIVTDNDLNQNPITKLETLGDMYLGLTNGKLFLFKIDYGAKALTNIVKLDPASFLPAYIYDIKAFHVTGGNNDFRGDGNIFKVFLSYYDSRFGSNYYVGSIDIVRNGGVVSFENFVQYDYDYPSNDMITDFAYVPKESANKLDLLMVGGKNLYLLPAIVPVGQDIFSKKSHTSPKTVSLLAQPNPFTNRVHISAEDLIPGTYNCSLFDNTGRRVYSTTLPFISKKQMQTLEMPSSLSKGVYFLKMEGMSLLRSIKLIKQ